MISHKQLFDNEKMFHEHKENNQNILNIFSQKKIKRT